MFISVFKHLCDVDTGSIRLQLYRHLHFNFERMKIHISLNGTYIHACSNQIYAQPLKITISDDVLFQTEIFRHDYSFLEVRKKHKKRSKNTE